MKKGTRLKKTMNENPEKNTPKNGSYFEKLALATTHYIGSFSSLVLHSIFFVGIFSLQWIGFSFSQIMLILTTVVSLEAIYLAIFIQMTVNHQAHKLAEVSDDVDDIQEDMEEISKDIDDIQEDVDDQEKITHIEGILKELLHEVRDLKEKHR